jgi:hypothetical protein
VTPEQIDLARHALGLGNGRRVSYRNYFVTGPGHSDHENWVAMVNDDMAIRRKGNAITGGDDIFHLTPAGAKAALNRGERLDPEDFPSVAQTQD